MKPRTFVLILLATAAGVLPRTKIVAQETQAPREPDPAYMLKADPKWAQRIDAALKLLQTSLLVAETGGSSGSHASVSTCVTPRGPRRCPRRRGTAGGQSR